MVLSLLLRLIGERGSASRGSTANDAPTQRARECGCYCGLRTPRNRARWVAVACLLAFGTACTVWLVHVSARIVSACDAQLTPQEKEDCFSGVVDGSTQHQAECERVFEEQRSCIHAGIAAKGQAFSVCYHVLFHVAYVAFIAVVILLCKMCCCTRRPAVAHGAVAALEGGEAAVAGAAESMGGQGGSTPVEGGSTSTPFAAPDTAEDPTTVPLLAPEPQSLGGTK